MSDNIVTVNQPGHERHGQNGFVVYRCNDQYTVEFCDHDAGRTRYRIEIFPGRSLRALVRQRVRV